MDDELRLALRTDDLDAIHRMGEAEPDHRPEIRHSGTYPGWQMPDDGSQEASRTEVLEAARDPDGVPRLRRLLQLKVPRGLRNEALREARSEEAVRALLTAAADPTARPADYPILRAATAPLPEPVGVSRALLLRAVENLDSQSANCVLRNESCTDAERDAVLAAMVCRGGPGGPMRFVRSSGAIEAVARSEMFRYVLSLPSPRLEVRHRRTGIWAGEGPPTVRQYDVNHRSLLERWSVRAFRRTHFMLTTLLRVLREREREELLATAFETGGHMASRLVRAAVAGGGLLARAALWRECPFGRFNGNHVQPWALERLMRFAEPPTAAGLLELETAMRLSHGESAGANAYRIQVMRVLLSSRRAVPDPALSAALVDRAAHRFPTLVREAARFGSIGARSAVMRLRSLAARQRAECIETSSAVAFVAIRAPQRVVRGVMGFL